jgi:phosphatidylglycerol:prolipoprotein diacylglycerol transferase
VGLSLAERGISQPGQAPENLTPNALFNLALAALIAGVVGARLSYVIRYPAAFMESPFSLVSLYPGLLDAWGGAAAGLAAALVYGNRKGLRLWPTLDAFVPALAVFAVALHLSHLASGAAFGAPVDLPWSVRLWGERRHPAQVYEALAAVLILWGTWSFGRSARPRPGGARFLTFLALSAGARLFLEAFRGDSTLLPGGLRLAQVLAWLVLAGCFYAWKRRDLPVAAGVK